jgi:HAD superfamily hydrolase (TIGR01490 family)
MDRAAFFDMDKTLLRVNSATRWVLRRVRDGHAPRSELLRLAGWLARYSIGVLDADALAARAVAPYAGVPEQTVREQTAAWIREEILGTLSIQARAELDRRRAAGHRCVLLTSATPYAAEPVARAVGISHVLCSRLEVRDGMLTGRTLRPLCYGEGKIAAAEQFAREFSVDLDRSSFFTDSISDLPMLTRVGEPVVVNPDARLLFEARRRGWPVRWWRE